MQGFLKKIIMIKNLHIAAQYLTAAAISFLAKEEDDSHTNLGWSNERNILSSRPLNVRGDYLALSFDEFALQWYSSEQLISSLKLEKQSHSEVLSWIDLQLKAAAISQPYVYSFHYDVGYSIDMNSFTFSEVDLKEINRIASLFGKAQLVMKNVLQEQELESEIRVWSHHFDIGAFTILSDTLSLGFGLAIPDSAIDDFYYYISGYNGHDSLDTSKFEQLNKGEWQTEDWKAGTLRAQDVDENTATQFFNETIAAFRKTYR